MNYCLSIPKLIRFFSIRLLLSAFFVLAFTARSDAQGYIEHSRLIGESVNYLVRDLKVDAAGNSYIIGVTQANDFPITLGPVPTGAITKGALIKLDPSGNRVWACYLPFSASGGGGADYTKMLLVNGTIYLIGTITVADIPVTDGSALSGAQDIMFTRVDAASGAILHNGFIGGSGAETQSYDMVIESGNVYIAYNTNSPNIPVTTGPAYTTGYDHVVMKLDATDNIVYNTYMGQIGTVALVGGNTSLVVQNGIAHLTTLVAATNSFTTTDGSTNSGGNDFAVLRLDASGNRSFASIVGGTAAETLPRLVINNGDIYISGITISSNYPVTDGSSKPNSQIAIIITKFNSSGNRVFGSYKVGFVTNPFSGLSTKLAWANGAIYMAVAAHSNALIVNTTDGSSNGGSTLLKIDPASGATQFATKFGQTRTASTAGSIEMQITADGIYMSSPFEQSNGNPTDGISTDGTIWNYGKGGAFVTKHTLDGQLLFASYLNAHVSVIGLSPFKLAVHNGKMYLAGYTANPTAFPVTDPPIGTLGGGNDGAWTVYNFCPPMPTDNIINPLSQSVCQNGFAQTLTGNEVIFTSQQMPVVYRNGAPQLQSEIRARYQWQVATSSTGPWSNIVAGMQKDYIPTPGTQTFYYRRLVLPAAGCGDIPVSISAVAEVVVGGDAAPTIADGIFNTCVNTAVNISLPVSGGTAPYTFAWDNGVSSTTNAATVTPTSNSVYTLTVTDNNGCQQIGQAIVSAYAADAGPAVSSCAGNPVRIGAAPPAGLSGVTYSWTPIAGLDDPTAAQPLATPGVTTVYTLQMTIPISGGGTCMTSDNTTVTVVAGPVTPNFAGADQAICLGGSRLLGTTAEGGFTYTWSPGSYLSSVTTSTTTFNAGTNMPQPNPYTYTLTASRNGCSFTDQVRVAVLAVDAGEDYCGPRTVGTADRMPGVTGKTFLWEVVSGPGIITGATNTATTTVSASASVTTYRVSVSYLGETCSDVVVVDPCGSGGCPDVEIDTLASHGCPSTTFGAVSLKASPSNLNPAQWIYTWSSVPAGGLSATTGHTITLTDNVERDVTVTVSRVGNPGISCSETIHVNDPAWSMPSFNAQDLSTCPGVAVSIGAPIIAGYNYIWQRVDAAQVNASNPSVTPAITTDYPVMVKDIASGCQVYDTSTVTVKPLILDPGPDWLVCNNAVIQLGSPAQTGYTYSWDPQVAAYQNATTYQSAEPQVLIAATQNFTLTVTDAETGCTADSTIQITVDASSALPAMTDTTICAGGSATIGLPEWGGVTYSWSPATGLSSTTVAQPTASPAATQVYTLVVTFYDAGGAPICTKTGSVTVTVASPQITMSDESICPSGALYNLSNGVTVTGATGYSWSPAILVTNPAALNTTVNVNPGTPTTFTLTAMDANGCSTSASKVVSPLNAAPEAGSQGFVCVGNSRTLGSSSNTGTLSWTVNPAIAGTLNPANGAEPVFTPAAADAGKTFRFVITQNIGGCINIDSVSVLVRSLVLPAMTAQTVCMNASATIGVPSSPNVTYTWTPTAGLTNPNAATTTVSSVTGTNVYTLTATDVYGCTTTGTASIGVNPVPAPSVTIPDVTVIMGSSGTPFSPQISPMPASYTYTWSPAQRVNNPYIANATARPEAPGTYQYDLTVTDANGCTTTAPALLNVITSSTLPVTISSLTATANSCSVRLSWKVESAERFSAFVVERKGTVGGYKDLRVISHDPSRSVYQFDDVDPGNGGWAYRLRLVDQDGRFRYSSIVFVPVDCTTGEKLVIYPNPVHNYISIKSSKTVSSLTLFSITGQIMMKKEYRQAQPGLIVVPIDKQLPQGIYFLQVGASDGTTQNVKLIKE